ncbi:MAG: 30S ribosome-binding factor RbfA [Bacteriovoracaceae bacterium]
MNNIKKQKLEEKILNSLNQYLRTGISDPRLVCVSLTKAELSHDLSQATVYWDSFSPEMKQEVEGVMGKLQGRFRSHLASVLTMRHIPQVLIKNDSQFEDQKHIEDLLKSETDSGKGFDSDH